MEATQRCEELVPQETIDTLLNLVEQVANDYSITLDFSHESIKKVEKILSLIEVDYKQTKDEEGLLGLTIEFGVYIAEVIKRQTKEGVLYRNHKNFGEASFPFIWQNSLIFPSNWCLKRILDGEGDNVWMKYKHFILKDKEPEKKSIWTLFR